MTFGEMLAAVPDEVMQQNKKTKHRHILSLRKFTYL